MHFVSCFNIINLCIFGKHVKNCFRKRSQILLLTFSARYRRYRRQKTGNDAENGTFMIKVRFSSHAWAKS